MLASQTGRATLRAAEATLELEAHADKRGRLQWSGIVRRPGLAPQATLEFSIRDEVGSLAKTIEAIERVGADMNAEPLPSSSLR